MSVWTTGPKTALQEITALEMQIGEILYSMTDQEDSALRLGRALRSACQAGIITSPATQQTFHKTNRAGQISEVRTA